MLEKRKKNIKIAYILILIISIILIGVTYAYFYFKTNTINHNITTDLLNIEYIDGALIRPNKIRPLKENEVEKLATELNFSVENKSNSGIYYGIKITDINASKGFMNKYLKWRLYEDGQFLDEGNFSWVQNENVILQNQLISSKKTKDYKVLIWLEESDEDQSELINSEFVGKIEVYNKWNRVSVNKNSLTMWSMNFLFN